MRITHLIHSLDRRSGGPSHALRELAHRQRLHHEVTVLASDAQSAEPWLPAKNFRQSIKDSPEFEGCDVRLLRGFGRHGIFRRFRFCPSLPTELATISADLFHIHGLFSHVTMAGAASAVKRRIPYIVRPAGGLNPHSLSAGQSSGKALLFRLWERRLYEKAAAIHVTSHREGAVIRKLFPTARIVLAPHGVVVPSQDEIDRSRWLLARHYPWAERRFVLFLSRLHQKKNPLRLIQAFHRIAEDDPSLDLVMAGSDAGELAACQREAHCLAIDKRVHFPGFLSGDLKTGAFASAALFALPSEDENFGLSVIEALAAGAPVLTTPGVDSHRYVMEADAGMICSPDADRMAEYLKEMLQIRNYDSKSIRAYVQQRLGWDRVIRKLDLVYQEIEKSPWEK